MTKKEVKCMKKINKVIKIINIISVILVILMFCNLIVTCFLPSDTKDYFEKQIIESSKFDVTFLFICQILILSVVNFKNLKNDNKEDKISVATVIISIIIYSILMTMSIFATILIKKCYIGIAVLSLLGIILQIIRLIFIIQNNRQLNLKNN
jgi:hypothetical protein